MYGCCLATEEAIRIRSELLNRIFNLDPKIRNLSNDKLLHLFYGLKLYSFQITKEIIKL